VITLASQPPDQPYQAAENPFDLRGLGGVPLVTYQMAVAVTLLAVVAAAGSLVVRVRRAGRVVEQTMQPTSASLWLQPSGSGSQDQSTTGASRAAW
jgi:hypothetical protein